MSNTGNQALASRVQADGALTVIPGFAPGVGKSLDQLPFVIESGAIDLVNATSNVSPQLCPFDATVVGVVLNVTVSPGTAPALLTIGRIGALASIVNNYSIATSASGVYDISTNAAVVGTSISKGDVITFNSDGGATGTGTAYAALVVIPRVA